MARKEDVGMSTFSRLCDAAHNLVQLEVRLGDVYTGYTSGDEILTAAWSRREELWTNIQRLAGQALSEARRDAAFSTIEKRVSKLVKHSKALYSAAWNIHVRKISDSERAAKAENEHVRSITELSRAVEYSVARLRLLADGVATIPNPLTKSTGKLNPTKKKILSLCRKKALPATAIARDLELSYDHTRRVLAQLIRADLLKNGPDGYRTLRAT
jgi:hypothetical protein